MRSSFLRAISAAFSSFVIPATCDVARSLAAGDAGGVPRGLREGESVATREVRAAEKVAGTVGDVSSVTGIGTGGGAGSSNAAHGSWSSDAPCQPTPTALTPPESAGALSNSSAE